MLKLVTLVIGVVAYIYTEFVSPSGKSHAHKNTYKHSATSSKAHTRSIDNVLAVSWQNAFCQLHQHKRECVKQNATMASATSFTLHGLWPQPRSKQNCSHKKLDLDKHTYQDLEKVMPGVLSGLHNHEWKKHGTCYGTSDETYFEDAISLINQLNNSAVQTLFKQNIGKHITKKQVMQAFDNAYGKGSGRKVKMMCQKGYITELQIRLGTQIDASTKMATLLKHAKAQMGGCNSGKVDKVGF